MPDSLIFQPDPVAVPPPLNEEDQKILNSYYANYGVTNKTPIEKVAVLQKKIGPREFFAFGGGETVEMELRANERVYLMLHAR